MVSFPKSQLIEALDYVRQRAVITPNGDEPPALYTTGVGCSQYGKLICERLNIKLVTAKHCFLSGFRCFVFLFVRTSEMRLRVGVHTIKCRPVFVSVSVVDVQQLGGSVVFVFVSHL